MKLRVAWIIGMVCLVMLFMFSFSVQAKEIKCGDWSASLCSQFGCTPLGCLYMGGKINGTGLVMDQTPFEKLGFNFGEGPYRVIFQRLNPGRYVISIHSMSDPEDRQEKVVKFKTEADALYPKLDTPPPEPGKYPWNQTIEYDIQNQVGIGPHYEQIGKNVAFLDLRVLDPEKLAGFGFPVLPKNDTRHQLLYLGDNRWRVSSSKGDVGPILVYESTTWKAEGPPAKTDSGLSSPPPETAAIQTSQTTSQTQDQTEAMKQSPQPSTAGQDPAPQPIPPQPQPIKPQPVQPKPQPVQAIPPRQGPPTQKTTVERNVERPGATYKNIVLDQGDPGLCAEKCEKDPKCAAFTYYRPGLKGDKAVCHLKNRVTNKKMKAGCYSGVKQQAATEPHPGKPQPPQPVPPSQKTNMERNVERPGATYKNIPLDQGDPGLCAEKCDEDPKCVACTYYRPGLKGKKAVCHLKNRVANKKIKAGCFSGVKPRAAAPQPGKPQPPQPMPPSQIINMERNVERPGATYLNITLDKGVPGLCAEECEKDPKCIAFTYYRPGLKGKKAACHLKNRVTKKQMKGGCYSGVKQQ